MSANHVLLQRIKLNASTPSITFNNLPKSGYKDLKIVMSVRSDYTSNYGEDVVVKFNNSTTGYYVTRFYNSWGTIYSDASSGAGYIGWASNGNCTANTFGDIELQVADYTSPVEKHFSFEYGTGHNQQYIFLGVGAGKWSGTDAISSLSLTSLHGNFVANCTFSLYGIAPVGAAPFNSPKASGGDIVVNDGEYWYHAFLTTGAFKPKTNLTCDYLVIAGGGAGGSANDSQHGGGGGGAGGYLSSVGGNGGGTAAGPKLTLTGGISYTATIGAGGSSNATGGHSSFNGLIASGGGYGAYGATMNGLSGGSGGGGSSSSSPGSGGAGTSGQGYAGGPGQGTNNYRTGGGGGAGAVGGSGSGDTTTLESKGGAGVAYASAFAYATNTGVNGYYAGGGGGGAGQFANPSNFPNGGVGGGGYGGFNGSPTYVATPGATNTGSGGGGSWAQGGYTNSGVGGNGGSGIVIVRYAMA